MTGVLNILSQREAAAGARDRALVILAQHPHQPGAALDEREQSRIPVSVSVESTAAQTVRASSKCSASTQWRIIPAAIATAAGLSRERAIQRTADVRALLVDQLVRVQLHQQGVCARTAYARNHARCRSAICSSSRAFASCSAAYAATVRSKPQRSCARFRHAHHQPLCLQGVQQLAHARLARARVRRWRARRRAREAAGEHRHAPQQRPLLARQQRLAPVQRRSQRSGAGDGSPSPSL